jgi:hypothetical protein
MNATMINNKEFVETLHAMESNINLRLLVSATKFYGKGLDDRSKQQLFALPLEDKMWLLNEYDQEIVPYPPADLDNIY